MPAQLIHPTRSLVAEIIVERPGTGAARGTGYRVASEWVLTAHHVIAGAVKLGVWFGAPGALRTDESVPVDPATILSAPAADLALVHVLAAPEPGTQSALLGRLDRDGGQRVPVIAAGFPRFKLRVSDASDARVRELHEAHGAIIPGSNRKTRTYELTDFAVVPGEDPEPSKHSPWEGMSGASVWADGRIVGVVAQHHPGDGLGALTIRPFEELLRGLPASELATWREALDPRLPARAGDLWTVVRQSTAQRALQRAVRSAEALAPQVLESRERELEAIDAFAGSDERWRWVQGRAYAGKTAMLAWAAAHPPPQVSTVSCFLRRPTGSNTAEYALDNLCDQVAAVADVRGYRVPSQVGQLRDELGGLIAAAARACSERGTRLLIVLDGLDEYDRSATVDLPEWLPNDATLPDGAALLASSREDVPVDVPPEHPLWQHVWPIDASDIGARLAQLAQEELKRALADASSLQFSIVGLLAAATGPLTSADLGQLLERLGQHAYVAQVDAVLRSSLNRTAIQFGTDTDEPAHALAHDALQTAAREAFKRDLVTFERALRGWCEDFRDAGWPEGTPVYVLAQYPRQLRQTGREQDLIALLDDESWYRRHSQADPSEGLYLTGVREAWSAAEAADAEDLSSDRPAARLGEEIRCALMVASIASRSHGIGASLLVALLDSGYWTQEQALTAARLHPSGAARARALAALSDRLSEPGRTTAIQDAVLDLSAVDDDMTRAWELRALAPRITRRALPDALEASRSIRAQLTDERRPRRIALAAVLARKAELGEDAALEEGLSLGSSEDRATVLAAVAPHLPSKCLQRILDAAHQLDYDGDRALVLAAVAGAQGPSAGGVLDEALAAARSSPPDDKSWALRQIAPHLPRDKVGEVIDIARREVSKGNQWTLMAALARRLAELGDWRAAVELAREPEDATWRARSLAAVVPFVPDDERVTLTQTLLEASRRSADGIRLAAPLLPEKLVRTELDRPDADDQATIALLERLAQLGHADQAFARAQRNPGAVGCLPALIPRLPAPLQTEACRHALTAAQAIGDEPSRAATLAHLVPHLPADDAHRLMSKLLTAPDRIPAGVLPVLIPELPDDLLEVALAVAEALPAQWSFGGVSRGSARADAVMDLAPRLPQPLRDRALRGAREAIDGIEDAVGRVQACSRLAQLVDDPPEVPDAVVREAEELARAVGPGYGRRDAAARVAAALGPEVAEELEQRARSSDEEAAQRARDLLEHLTDRPSHQREWSLGEALSAAKSIETESLRADALALLAPHLEELLQLSGDDWNDSDDEFAWRQQVTVIETLAPALAPDQLRWTLETALAMSNQRAWVAALRALYPRLAELPRAQLHPLWRRTLQRIALRPRSSLLSDLTGLVPVILALGGGEAIVGIETAVTDTGERWP